MLEGNPSREANYSTMKTTILLRHVAHENAGTLETALRKAGLPFTYIDLYDGAPADLPWNDMAALAVLGGPMNVDETDRYPFLAAELPWIRRAVASRLPVLGVCLGSQLLAKAHGARVYPNGIKEIGWYALDLMPEAGDDPLFGGRNPAETVFQWHGDTFDLPDGAVHLARSPLCKHQAFRLGPCAWGLQFHVEMTEAMVRDWLAEPGNCGELAGLDYINAQAILDGIPHHLPAMQDVGAAILARFTALVQAAAA